MGRARCCDRANVKRGPWSPEEDAILKLFLQNHGIGGSWTSFPQRAGLRRCGKSCRLRWLNYLRPNIKHGGFTDEEENLICTLYRQIGSRWAFIASQMPGRTDNDVKNYWNTKLKKKLFAGKTSRGSIQNPPNYTTNPATHCSPTLPCDNRKGTTAYASNANFADYLLTHSSTTFSTLSVIGQEGHVPYPAQSLNLVDPFQFSAVAADIKPRFEFIGIKPPLNSHLISFSQEGSSVSDSSSLHMDNKCNVVGLEEATAGMFICDEGFFAYDDLVNSSLMCHERANEVGSNCFNPCIFS